MVPPNAITTEPNKKGLPKQTPEMSPRLTNYPLRSYS